jgi:hypothetical protein
VGLLIWVMIVPMLLKVAFGALSQVKSHWREIAVTRFVNWAVKPCSMVLLGWIFIRHVFAAQGLLAEPAPERVAQRGLPIGPDRREATSSSWPWRQRSACSASSPQPRWPPWWAYSSRCSGDAAGGQDRQFEQGLLRASLKRACPTSMPQSLIGRSQFTQAR